MEKLWELMFPKHEGAPRHSDGAMILEEQLRCSSIRVVQNSRSCDPVASYGLRKIVTYVNLKNAATDLESDAAGRNYRLVIAWSAESLTDRSVGRETRRIASRLTFEFQFDARDSRSPSDTGEKPWSEPARVARERMERINSSGSSKTAEMGGIDYHST